MLGKAPEVQSQEGTGAPITLTLDRTAGEKPVVGEKRSLPSPDGNQPRGPAAARALGGSWVEIQAVLPLTPLSGQEQRGLGCGVRGGGEAGIQPRPWDLACLPLTPLWPPPPDASNLQAVFSGTAPGALSFLPGLEGLPLRVLWEHPS